MRPAQLVAALLLVGTGAPGCSPIDCSSGIHWEAVLPGVDTEAEIRGLTVRMCLNGECAEGTLEIEGRSVTLLPNCYAIVRRDREGARRIHVESGGRRALDGDRLAIEVRDATGAVVVGLTERAIEYVVTDPNGLLGDECRYADLSGSTLSPDGG